MNIRSTVIVILVVVLGLFGGLLYFASQISAVYPPIRKYDYSKSFVELKSDLYNLTETDPQITAEITDTTGTGKNGFAYYIRLRISDEKKDNEYNIAYKQEETWLGKRETKIFLIGAFDRLRRTGGYKAEDRDVERLVTLFEKDFYKHLTGN